MLTEEQAKQLKEKILEQIDSWQTSEEQKALAKEQIEAMPSQELEDFLIKNKLVGKPEKEACPFCLISEGKLPSYKIAETHEALAVLEINPLSRGHTIILPKQHTEKISPETEQLASEISKLLKGKLKPEEIKHETSNLFGHIVINLIPVYKEEKLERKKSRKRNQKSLKNLKKHQEEFLKLRTASKIIAKIKATNYISSQHNLK